MNGTVEQSSNVSGIPPTIELCGSAAVRSASEINAEILSGLDSASNGETVAGNPEADGAGGVSAPGPSSAGKTIEQVRNEWYYVAAMALRLTKGLFFNRKKISKEQYKDCSDIWTEYLTKRYPDGLDDAELIMALLATGSMFTGADDRPETEEDKQTGLWAYLKRIGKALVGG